MQDHEEMTKGLEYLEERTNPFKTLLSHLFRVFRDVQEDRPLVA